MSAAGAHLDEAADALARMAQGEAPSHDAGPTSVRRWDAAQTSRLNSAHWANAQGQPINADISADHETLITRSTHEAANNPLMAGVIETHVADVVGADGPTLEIQSDSEQFNRWAEDHWRAWWAAPDIENPYVSGVDKLDLWLRMMWKTGEFVEQYTNDELAEGPVQLRLKAIHARYLQTPMAQLANDHIVLGVEKDAKGRILGYHIVDSRHGVQTIGFYGFPDFYRLEEILHDFIALEPDQARGVPWAASCLQVIADLRDADAQILDAIRQAADFGVLLVPNEGVGSDQDLLNPGSTAKYQRRQITTTPPGYSPHQMKPEQPGTNLIDYRNERLRELGRPANMPLVKLKGESDAMNFSQTKFALGNYWRSVAKLQRHIERRDMNRLLNDVLREARIAEISEGRRVPRPPRRWQAVWTWPGQPRVDPRIEAIATQVMRQIGGATMSDVLAPTGKTVEQHARQEARERDIYANEGVPYPETGAVVDSAKAGVMDEVLSNNE